MAKIHFILCYIFLVAFGFISKPPRTAISLNKEAQAIISIAQSQVGVREATANNDGPQVEQYLKYTGNTKGQPWCASFVSWVHGQAGLKQPKTAWSPALFPSNRLVKSFGVGDVFGIYFPALKRVAHVGFVESRVGDWLYTIEGNTNAEGSREGDGVYRKMRKVKTVKVFANWRAMRKEPDGRSK